MPHRRLQAVELWRAPPLLLCALLHVAPASAQQEASPSAPRLATTPDNAASNSKAFERPPQQASDAATLPSRDQHLARQLDGVLSEAARDLSLTMDLLVPTTWGGTDATALEARLLEASDEGWAIAPQLERRNERLILRLLAVPPGASLLRVMRVELEAQRLELQAISALRAITNPQEPTGQSEVSTPTAPQSQLSPRSEGRAVLAVSGALAGGYFGFSLEHIGGSGDPRLVYPLMTLGAAVGVGASLVISEEWDIAPAEAWYSLAGITWPTAAGLLIAQRIAEDPDDQFLYGAIGTFAGLTLGTVGVNAGEIEPAGALLAHSGGFFGAIFGALAERLAEPTESRTPTLGMGVGMTAGSLLGGWGATLLRDVPSSRIVYIDLATVLGMLAGAAAASPAIVGQEQNAAENRVWFSATTAGGLIGATLGVLLTRQPNQSGGLLRSVASTPPRALGSLPAVSPMIIPLHFSDATSPVTAFGLSGRW